MKKEIGKDKVRLFNEEQKSFIFQRDLGFCQKTGRSLWYLDTGVWLWDSAVIDHIVPHAKGGVTEIDNGMLLSGWENSFLSDDSKKYYNYALGIPTMDYFVNFPYISSEQEEIIIKHSNLLCSDYYFNSAIENVLFALNYRYEPLTVKGTKKERDDKYYLKIAVNKLKKWRENREINYLSFEERNLVSDVPEKDQELFLKFRDISTVDDGLKILDDLEPYYKKSHDIHLCFYKDYNNFVKLYLENRCTIFIDPNNMDNSINKVFIETLSLCNGEYILSRQKKSVTQILNSLKKITSQMIKVRKSSYYSYEHKAHLCTMSFKNMWERERQDNDFYVLLDDYSKIEKDNQLNEKELDNIFDCFWAGYLTPESVIKTNNLEEYKKFLNNNDLLLEYALGFIPFSEDINVFVISDEEYNSSNCRRGLVAKRIELFLNTNILEYNR